MFNKLVDYWKRTKYVTTWEIYYRKIDNGSLLDDNSEPFVRYDIPKDYWGADPLLFEYNGEIYFFFELWDNKKKKGSIACSTLKDGKTSDYKIVLELDIHLSFPFIFEHNKNIYMIPETGSTHNVRLFKTKTFPYEWVEEKVLVDNVESSDNIVYQSDKGLVLLTSIKNPSPSTCFNRAYLLDEDLNVIKTLYDSPVNNYGIRNAGQLFKWNDKLIRPGQDCSGDNYGIGIVMFDYDINSDQYNEACLKNIKVNDINIANRRAYSGIHTYSLSSKYEIIDLRIRKKHPFAKRIWLVIERIINKAVGNK